MKKIFFSLFFINISLLGSQEIINLTISLAQIEIFTRKISNSLQAYVFQNLVNKSQQFEKQTRVSFPTQANRIATIAGNDPIKKATIVNQAKETYPIMHTKVRPLIDDFLRCKKTTGSEIEKKLYETMTFDAFINRLLINRPLAFLNPSDKYLLQNSQRGEGGFEAIGTDNEKLPLLFNDYLSYDEMQISALLGVSSPTYFINNGSRNNNGNAAAAGTYQETGVYVALVGARFERKNVMEWKHMIITPEQNTLENGYGRTKKNQNSVLQLWEKFYDTTFPTYQEAESSQNKNKFTEFYLSSSTKPFYLNNDVYKKRMRLVLEPFLLDANKRGQTLLKTVYVHITGLGMGAWKALNQQENLFFDVCQEILKDLDLPFIHDIDFSWFNATKQNMQTGKNTISIKFSKRNPADSLQGSDKDKLLVACFAWDGNSYTGNEYWMGSTNASADPAAASCSTVAELQNPRINDHVAAKYLQTCGLTDWKVRGAV